LHETDVCLVELVIRLPKPQEEIRTLTPKILPTFTSEGKSTLNSISFVKHDLKGVLKCIRVKICTPPPIDVTDIIN